MSKREESNTPSFSDYYKDEKKRLSANIEALREYCIRQSDFYLAMNTSWDRGASAAYLDIVTKLVLVAHCTEDQTKESLS